MIFLVISIIPNILKDQLSVEILIFEEIELIDVQINNDSRHCKVNPGSAKVNVENKAI